MATNSFPFKLNPFKLELKNRLIVLLFLYLLSKFITLERVKMNKQKGCNSKHPMPPIDGAETPLSIFILKLSFSQ